MTCGHARLVLAVTVWRQLLGPTPGPVTAAAEHEEGGGESQHGQQHSQGADRHLQSGVLLLSAAVWNDKNFFFLITERERENLKQDDC